MHFYCTYFDHRFLPKGLALYQSLCQHDAPFQLWILCMDRLCYEILRQLKLPSVELVELDELERCDPELAKTKQDRTAIEYYFTCTPSLPLFILNNFQEVNLITYLDADIFFFDNPKPVYDELCNHSVGIIPHRFPTNFQHKEVFGIYNVGWLSFRKDHNGLKCLKWWRERCLEWCYDRLEDGRFADQKYLDDWPSRFQQVVVLQHKGANLAPWNAGKYILSSKNGEVRVDEQSLIFFHFHGFKEFCWSIYDPNLASYGVKATGAIKRSIFAPYIEALFKTTRLTKGFIPKGNVNIELRNNATMAAKIALPSIAVRCRTELAIYNCAIKNVISRTYICAINGKVV